MIRDHTDSPFSPENLRTDAGFFSALVFRAITQSTPALLQGHVLFETLDDFSEIALELGEENMANKTALGKTPNRHRETATAKFLWEAGTARRDEMFDPNNDTPKPFLTTFNLLRKKTTEKHQNFLGYGDLTAYLLTADYTYTNAVMAPTCEDMATAICAINRGAITGLRLLGLLPGGKSKPSVVDTRIALQKAYSFLERKIPSQQKTLMGFDYIMLEHALCKLSRLNRTHHIISWFVHQRNRLEIV